MTPLDDMALLEEFVEIFNQLRIPFVIGGSIASSIHGEVRFTQDADLCVEPFDSQIIPRRQYARLTESSPKECPILSPEDTILMKMRWYVEGGMQSQRQWDDILGVLRVQRGNLDMGYLEIWASRWSSKDLLDRLIHEAGLDC